VCQSLSVVDEGFVRVVQRVPESEKIIKSWPEKKCDLAKNRTLITAKFYRASNWQGECIRALVRCDSIREHGLQHLLYNRSHRGHRHSPEIARVVLTAGVHGIQVTALKDADSPWSNVSAPFRPQQR
jgi:hypothetical protein